MGPQWIPTSTVIGVRSVGSDGSSLFLVRFVAFFSIVAAGAVAGLAWTGYTDGIKAAAPATAWLTSTALRDWNLGTIAQRLDPATWRRIFLGWLPGLGLVVFLSPFVVWRSRLGVWALATLLLGPLLFTNLYWTHDYYWMAVGPAAAVLIGMVGDRALRVKVPARRVAAVALLTGMFALSFVVYQRWILMLRPDGGTAILTRAAQIQAAAPPGALVAIDGYGWSPELLFYADRFGYMEDPRIPPAPPGYIHFHCTSGAKGVCVRD